MHTTPRCLPRKRSQGHFVTCLNDALLPPFSDHIELGQTMRGGWTIPGSGLATQKKRSHNWSHFQSCLEENFFNKGAWHSWILTSTVSPSSLSPQVLSKKSVFERVFLFVPTTRACPLLLLFCARATGQLSNVCYLCWRSLVIKTGLVVVLLLCSASVNSIQIQTFSMKKRKKNTGGHSFHFCDTNLICHMFFMASASSQIQFFYFLCNYHTHHKPTTGENTRIDIPTSSFVYLERANLFGFPSIATTDVNRVLRGRSSLLAVQLVRLDDK